MADQDVRYHGHKVGQDEIVILDKFNNAAWVQSDAYIEFQDL